MKITTRYLALAMVVGCSTALGPPTDTSSNTTPGRGTSELAEGEASVAKLSTHLLEARRLAEAGKTLEEIEAAEPQVRFEDGLAEVEVRLDRLTHAILQQLRAAGLEDWSHSFKDALAYGRVRLENLDELAAVPEVSTIQPMPRGGTRASTD